MQNEGNEAIRKLLKNPEFQEILISELAELHKLCTQSPAEDLLDDLEIATCYAVASTLFVTERPQEHERFDLVWGLGIIRKVLESAGRIERHIS